MISLVYYTKAGNTERFCSKLFHSLANFEPHSKLKMTCLTSEDGSPRSPLSQITHIWSYESEHEDPTPNRTVIVTPSYGVFDHQQGRTAHFTPQPVLDFISKFSGAERGAVSVIVGGNRTFGADFAAASRELDLPLLGTFELHGTKDEIKFFTKAILGS